MVDRLRDRNSLGNNPLMARVTTIVVIKNLSAAGSRMLPSTVPIPCLRAR